MKNTDELFIINIGRQVGAGGLEIGRILAELFNIDFYDKKLLEMVAKETGIDSQYFEKADEKPSNKFLFAFTNNPLNVNNENVLSRDELFKFQANVIREIASKKSCVIVGRTSDYILRDFKNSFNIFIHAPIEKRVEFLMKKENMSDQSASHLINKIDKMRMNYYNFYTNKEWGNTASYHLSVDSSVLGFEDTAKLIHSFVKQKLLIQK